MVEGSKVDWAAHLNDPVGVITEFLAFEKAVNLALEYAKKNKNTVVIVCADHATGGFSIGNKFSEKKTNYNNDPKYIQYNHLPYKTIVDNLKMYSLTGDGFERLIETKNQLPDTLNRYFKKYYGQYYQQAKNISFSDSVNNYFKNKKSEDRKLALRIGINNYISENAYIGWTTKGHTGEDVPLYIYHPDGFTLHGTIDNTQIANYISEMLGLQSDNKDSNKKYFAEYDLRKSKNHSVNGDTLLFVKGNDKYRFFVNTNVYYINEVPQKLNALILKLGDKLYAPEELINVIK